MALLRGLTRRFLPETPPWMLGLGAVALVTGSAIPFLLRRAYVYEVAIAAACCFAMAAMYLLPP